MEYLTGFMKVKTLKLFQIRKSVHFQRQLNLSLKTGKFNGIQNRLYSKKVIKSLALMHQVSISQTKNFFTENVTATSSCHFNAPIVFALLLQLTCLCRQLFFFQFSSVQFSCSVVSNYLRPHESQHARPPCPSPTPGVHSDPRPSSQ